MDCRYTVEEGGVALVSVRRPLRADDRRRRAEDLVRTFANVGKPDADDLLTSRGI